MKILVKRIVSLSMLFVFLCGCGACGKSNEQKNTLNTEAVETDVVRETYTFDDRVAMDTPIRRLISTSTYHDGYLYYFDNGMCKRLNLETGRVSSPCADPLCTHADTNCPFFTQNVPSIKFFDEWIVIQSHTYVNAKRTVKRILYNSQTKEWKEIFKSEDGGATQSSNIMQIGHYLYHVTFGMARVSNGESYLPSDIQRYNLKTGVEDVIYSHPYMIDVTMAGENRLYFHEEIDGKFRFYSVDVNGKDFREEPTIKIEAHYAYQNKIYSYSHMEDEYIESRPIFMNDLTTGEVVMIAEDHVTGSMCIYEDHFYYLTKDYYSKSYADLQAVVEEGINAGVNPYKTEPYAGKIAEIEHRRYIATGYLWKCDLNGENQEMILELPGVGNSGFYLSSDYLYTIYEFYDTQSGELLGTADEQGRPCRIHLTTGEVEFLHKLGAE